MLLRDSYLHREKRSARSANTIRHNSLREVARKTHPISTRPDFSVSPKLPVAPYFESGICPAFHRFEPNSHLRFMDMCSPDGGTIV